VALLYTRDDAHRRIRLVLSGYIEAGDVEAAMRRQATEGTWPYGVLYDARPTSWTPTEGELQALAATLRDLVAQHGGRGPVAIVVTNQRAFTVARSFAALAASVEAIEVFLDYGAADHWLNAHASAPIARR
jgi:hypothetical protein